MTLVSGRMRGLRVRSAFARVAYGLTSNFQTLRLFTHPKRMMQNVVNGPLKAYKTLYNFQQRISWLSHR